METGTVDPTIARLVMYVYPLPPESVQDLHDHLRESISAWLRDNKIASGDPIDILNKGLIQ